MDQHKLTEIILELRNASIFVRRNPSDENIRNLMNKYDQLFLGSEVNLIYTHELVGTINDHFNVPVTIDELHAIIHSVCKNLSIDLVPMVALTDLSNPNPKISTYQIFL